MSEPFRISTLSKDLAYSLNALPKSKCNPCHISTSYGTSLSQPACYFICIPIPTCTKLLCTCTHRTTSSLMLTLLLNQTCNFLSCHLYEISYARIQYNICVTQHDNIMYQIMHLVVLRFNI